MARGDKEYFRTEVAFVDGPEFRRLSGAAYKLYDVLQARCIATRRVVLYGLDCSWLAAASGLTHQRVPSALGELAGCLYGKGQQPLIKVQPTGNLYTIKVEGMDRNNARFKWEESPDDPREKSPKHLLPEQNEPEQNKPEHSDSPPPGDVDDDIKKRSKGKSPKPKSEIQEPEKFDAFWKLYPRKVNKTGAVKKWNATLVTGETDADQLVAAAEGYSAKTTGKEEKYIMHPATFLGPDQRWKDFLNVEISEIDKYIWPEGWTPEMKEASLAYGREDREGQYEREGILRDTTPAWHKRISHVAKNGRPEIQDRADGVLETPVKVGGEPGSGL